MISPETRASSRPSGGQSSADAVLLSRWCEGDPAALEELIRRHGGMVLGVCRRVLGGRADADDAFQATFLVLVHKAHKLTRPAEVAAWLHQVALRVALKNRAVRGRRHAIEGAAVDVADSRTPDPSDSTHDLRQLLDEELDRLPEKYRLPIVLCELEERTLDEAAHILDWPKGTVACRLSRGRELLRQRLTHRRIAPALLLLPGILPGARAEPVPDQLVSATLAAAAKPTRPRRKRPRLMIPLVLLLAGGTALAVPGWYLRSALAGPSHADSGSTPVVLSHCHSAPPPTLATAAGQARPEVAPKP